MMLNPDEILEEMTAWQESLECLANDGRQHLADARLSVFRSESHWAVLTEFPQYFYMPHEFVSCFGCAGNCLIEGSYDWRYSLTNTSFASLIEAEPDLPLIQVGEYYEWVADRAHFAVRIQNQRHEFFPTAEDYAQAEIYFDGSKTGPGTINPGQLLRFLSVHLHHPFFAEEATLRTSIQPDIEPTMKLWLQTRHWTHPKYLVMDIEDDDFADDVISNIPCWQILARAIASGDLTEWNAQDPESFNTDWASLEAIRAECDLTE